MSFLFHLSHSSSFCWLSMTRPSLSGSFSLCKSQVSLSNSKAAEWAAQRVPTAVKTCGTLLFRWLVWKRFPPPVRKRSLKLQTALARVCLVVLSLSTVIYFFSLWQIKISFFFVQNSAWFALLDCEIRRVLLRNEATVVLLSESEVIFDTWRCDVRQHFVI